MKTHGEKTKSDHDGKQRNDPVCGMDTGEFDDAVHISHEQNTYFFCGEWCAHRFKKNPSKFLGEPIIKLRRVRKFFKLGGAEIKVLRDLDLNVWSGDFVAIIGASGSGKSTSLNMMGLLDQPTSGHIFLKGKNASHLGEDKRAEMRSKLFGFVFQQYNLIPWLNAYENVILPLVFARDGKRISNVDKRFEEVGLKDRKFHRPMELSGGEQQRVALLRALANDPEIILGDEPTGNLDSETGNKILEMLIALNKLEGKTLVVVTHDADIAEKADQIIALKDGHPVRNHRAQKKIYTE